MKNVVLTIFLLLPAMVAPPELTAQQAPKLSRVGRVSAASADPRFGKASFEAFRQALHDLGWVEGRNIVVGARWAEGKPERVPELVADLVRLRVDVIVAVGAPIVRAAKDATATIPIVMAGTGTDPVAAGFVASLARPGGNITGLSPLAAALDGKRLELLKELAPDLERVAVLQNPEFPQAAVRWREAEEVARFLGVRLQAWDVRGPHAIESAFAGMGKMRPNALLVFSDPVILETNRGRIVALALKHRLPAIYPWRVYVEEGGLMAYAPNLLDVHRRAATYVDKILKGAKPGALPVEQPTKFELVINLKTAKALGLTIPPELLTRADQVIR